MDKVLEKLDLIEQKQSEKVDAVKSEILDLVTTSIETAKTESADAIAALEAKVASIGTPALIKRETSIRQGVNRMVREQLADFHKAGKQLEKEIKLFESEDQYDAYIREAKMMALEASALTGSGTDKGGRTAYDPVFVALRLANPLRGVSRTVATDGSQYQFRVKTGNAGAQWGYGIQNNGAKTTENTNIWQINLKDVNAQFPIRTAALDDIDGLEANVVDDMLAEFAQTEAISMIQNNDQSGDGTTVSTGGADGLRGLNQYGGEAGTYAGGSVTTAAFGTSGTGATSGLADLATYDQIVTNGDVVGAANVQYKDVVNFIYSLPQQYWTPDAKLLISPTFLAQIRGLTDDNGTPVFERMDPLVYDGIVGRVLGFDVVVNKYLDNPSGVTATGSDATSLYPAYFADWSRFHTIVDRLSMVLRRYDQTLPGYITFFGEKRLASSVRDPFAGVRYRSTATANKS